MVDENGEPNGTAAQSTPLPHIGYGTIAEISDSDADGNPDTLKTDGAVNLLPGGLKGLRINPDITQDETFLISNNTEDTITVVTPNENGVNFDAVAQAGDTYCGWYVFGNVEFRRGGNLVLGDHLKVVDTMRIAEYGLLTSYDTTSNYFPRIDLDAGVLIVDSTGSIDVTGKGYPGGKGSNDSGITLGYNDGSEAGAGGSYGGLGGSYNNAKPNDTYGNEADPIELGSGGGAWGSVYGGNGGGRVFITAGSITINGSVKANGASYQDSAAGGGSGGTVNIRAGTIDGGGTIEANGGGEGTSSGVGGGGGRIAIRYSDSMGIPEDNIKADGGIGHYGNGENGTVYIEEVH